MSIDAREMMTFLAAGYEKLADGMGQNLEKAARQLPADASEYDRGYLDGYCAGHVKTYRDLADDLRKVLREKPPSNFNWPRILIGFSWRF